jgi:hypothetical protein
MAMRTISARGPLPGHERDPDDDHDQAGCRGGAGEAAHKASIPTATAGTRNVQAKTRALVQWLRAT